MKILKPEKGELKVTMLSVKPTATTRDFKSEFTAVFRKSDSSKTLWMTTFAFFLTFVIWFNMAPFALSIAKTVGLNKLQIAALLLCNLVLAVPGRVLAGRLLDRYGPRKLFGWLLITMAVPNAIFAFSSSFMELAVSRLFIGLVGSGFVIGIRLVSEWHDSDHMGIAEGLYGGWVTLDRLAPHFFYQAWLLYSSMAQPAGDGPFSQVESSERSTA